MSVLINGMEMPKACNTCPCFERDWQDDDIVGYCKAKKAKLQKYKIPFDCPLVEIPTPHGDLVDLTRKVNPNDSMRLMTIDEQLQRTCEGWSAEKEYCVIIPAERSES